MEISNLNDDGGLYTNNKRKINNNFGDSNYYSQTNANGGGSASTSIMSPHGSNLFNLLLPRENLTFTQANNNKNNTFSGPYINDLDPAQGLNSLTSTDKLLLS
jgi:hypothetical protein